MVRLCFLIEYMIAAYSPDNEHALRFSIFTEAQVQRI